MSRINTRIEDMARDYVAEIRKFASPWPVRDLRLVVRRHRGI